ncbi:hypothetical protein [Streptomyces prunicolor]|uniref:hypothetical protein n=1 Tax=Streptomyces prunicolor TaxID=67348 RepID=UPI000375DFFD|nr:hypothetical protein [Streptomyces prunicolor]
MLGLTTTRHLRTVEARLTDQLTQACTSAELERRRLERAHTRERTNLRGRLDRALHALAATRHELASTNGALRIVSEALIDQRHSSVEKTRSIL